MTYRTATITNASPALALCQEIEAGFGEHANWDYVKDVVIGTFTYRVWKSRGTGSGANAFGQDYFLAFRYQTAAGGLDLRVVAFEAFTPSDPPAWTASTAYSVGAFVKPTNTAANPYLFEATTAGTSGATEPTWPTSLGATVTSGTAVFTNRGRLNKAIRPCVGAASSLAPNANGSHGDEVNGFGLDSATLVYASITLPTTAFASYVSISNERVCAAVNYSTTDHAFYAGLFEPLSSTEPFPLAVIATSGQENALTVDSGVSRHPGRTAAATDNFKFQVAAWTVISGTTQTADLFHGGGLASRALFRTLNADAATYGNARGLLHDAILLPDGSTATRNGDTLTIGADVYTKMRCGTYGFSSGIWVRQSVI